MNSVSTVPGGLEFRSLASADELEHLVEASNDHPVLVFKHSPTCGTSAEAHEELTTFLAESGHIPVYLVHVTDARHLSNTLAARFGVPHQSPQVLLLFQGTVRWTASHYRVTAAEVRRAVGALPVA